jgi:hypothetical protein
MACYLETFKTNNKACVPAALLGGLFACYLTQPVDTIKTCKVYESFMQTGKKIMDDYGPTGLFCGVTFCNDIWYMLSLLWTG